MNDDEIYELALEVSKEYFDIYFAVPPSREAVVAFGKRMWQASRKQAGWQPIETAPKDGTEILLFRGPDTYEGKPVSARVTCGSWVEWEETASEYHGTTGEYLGQSVQDGGASWMSWDGGFREEAPPTHWMPLPQPPAMQKD